MANYDELLIDTRIRREVLAKRICVALCHPDHDWIGADHLIKTAIDITDALLAKLDERKE